MDFNDSKNGILVGKWLGENNELPEHVIVSEIRKLSEVTVLPIYDDNQLVAFHFPSENIYLYRWGFDLDPVWVDEDLDEELFGEEGTITKVYRGENHE